MTTKSNTFRFFHSRSPTTISGSGWAFDDIAVRSGGQARRKFRAPRGVLIVDGYKAGRACTLRRELF